MKKHLDLKLIFVMIAGIAVSFSGCKDKTTDDVNTQTEKSTTQQDETQSTYLQAANDFAENSWAAYLGDSGTVEQGRAALYHMAELLSIGASSEDETIQTMVDLNQSKIDGLTDLVGAGELVKYLNFKYYPPAKVGIINKPVPFPGGCHFGAAHTGTGSLGSSGWNIRFPFVSWNAITEGTEYTGYQLPIRTGSGVIPLFIDAAQFGFDATEAESHLSVGSQSVNFNADWQLTVAERSSYAIQVPEGIDPAKDFRGGLWHCHEPDEEPLPLGRYSQPFPGHVTDPSSPIYGQDVMIVLRPLDFITYLNDDGDGEINGGEELKLHIVGVSSMTKDEDGNLGVKAPIYVGYVY